MFSKSAKVTSASLMLTGLGFLVNLSANPVQALSFDLRNNYNSSNFASDKTNSPNQLFEEKWVVQSRTGSGNTTRSQNEIDIVKWTSNTSQNNVGGTQRNLPSGDNWENNVLVPFTLSYVAAGGGTATYGVTGASSNPFTRSNLNNDPSRPGLPNTINTLVVRVNAPANSSTSTNNTTLSRLTIQDETGDTYSYNPDLVTGSTNLGPGPLAAKESYLFINGIQGDFTVTGEFKFSWTGTGLSDMPGGNSEFIKEFKGFTTASVPGPLPFLGLVAAFGWSRKIRKRIQKKESFSG